MARSKSSSRWLKEHFDDVYVKKSQEDGFRSRASYKLMSLDDKDRLLTPGAVVVDLGSAPGGWSQVAAQRVGAKGRVVASDILEMAALGDVQFIQGDFTELSVFNQIVAALGDGKADLVLSDMAPNMSGVIEADIPRAMYLVELALEFSRQVLRPDGVFAVKVFQGEGFDALLKDMRQSFMKVVSRKPDASRARSREIYMVCKGFKGGAE